MGALGLGTIVTMLASTAAVDVTGILAAGALSVIGLLVLPARRARRQGGAADEGGDDAHEAALAPLVVQFEQERSRACNASRRPSRPYTRFVRAERERLDDAEADLARIRDGLGRIRAQIEAA